MLATLMLSWIVLCGVLCGSFAEETGFDYLRTKLGSWVKSIPTFTTPSTSTQGKPLTTGMDVYGGYYLEYAVAPTNSDCSGPGKYLFR